MAFVIRQHDRLPILAATLTDATGAAVDLTTATAVRFHLKTQNGNGATPINQAAAVVNASAGQVSYSWASGDTDVAGAYNAEFEVTWADGRLSTFPNLGYIAVVVTKDLA